MKTSYRKSALLVIALFSIGFCVPGTIVFGQEKKSDPAKIFEEIVGDYAFSHEGQSMTLAFWVKDGKLTGAPRGQESESAVVIPVDLENLKFETTTPEGQYYEISFTRDENKKVAKCILKTMGIEVEGARIK